MSSLAQKHDTSETAHDDDDTSARAVKAPKLTTPAAPVCIMDGGMGHQLRRLGVLFLEVVSLLLPEGVDCAF